MNRRFFLSTVALVMTLSVFPQMHTSAKSKAKPAPPDLRNIVTDVNQSTKTVTITSELNNDVTVLTLADPKWYKIQIVIDGQEKPFSSVVKGLLYVTSEEVESGVVDSITLATTAAVKTTTKTPAKPKAKTPSSTN